MRRSSRRDQPIPLDCKPFGSRGRLWHGLGHPSSAHSEYRLARLTRGRWRALRIPHVLRARRIAPVRRSLSTGQTLPGAWVSPSRAAPVGRPPTGDHRHCSGRMTPPPPPLVSLGWPRMDPAGCGAAILTQTHDSCSHPPRAPLPLGWRPPAKPFTWRTRGSHRQTAPGESAQPG